LALYEQPAFAVGMAAYELSRMLDSQLPPDVRRRLERAVAALREAQQSWAAMTGYPYGRG